MMNKIRTGLQYKARIYGSMSAWYISIYLVSMILIYAAFIITGIIGNNGTHFIYRIFGSVVFLFAVFIRFKEDFNFLLTLSFPRRDIFLTKLSTAMIYSTIFSILILIERVIVDYLNSLYNLTNITDPFHFFAPYATSNLFLQFVYFLMLGFCCSVSGILIGSLIYRLGNKFTVSFWLIFSAVPTIFFPIFLWLQYRQGELKSTMTGIIIYLRTFNLLGASGSLLVISVILSIAIWINTRRLSQSA